MTPIPDHNYQGNSRCCCNLISSVKLIAANIDHLCRLEIQKVDAYAQRILGQNVGTVSKTLFVIVIAIPAVLYGTYNVIAHIFNHGISFRRNCKEEGDPLFEPEGTTSPITENDIDKSSSVDIRNEKVITRFSTIDDKVIDEGEKKQLVPLQNNVDKLSLSTPEEFFFGCYNLLTNKKEELTSIQYGKVMQIAEKMLLEIKLNHSIESNPDQEHTIKEMDQLFEELYQKTPLGPGVLLQRDLDKLSQLDKRPEHKTYISTFSKTEGIAYYEPQVSSTEILDYFSLFRQENNYVSTCIDMKGDDFFGLRKFYNWNFTAISFRRAKLNPILLNFKQSLNSLLFDTLIAREEKKMALNKLVTAKYKEWEYDSFEIVHVSDFQEELEEKGIDASEWGFSVILYHKKVQPGFVEQ